MYIQYSTPDTSVFKQKEFIKLFGDGIMWSLMFNVNGKIPNQGSTSPVPSFHWNGGHEAWDFPVDTDHKWWILFIFISYQNMWIVHVLFFDILQCWQEKRLMFLEPRTRECMMVMWINIDLSITFQIMIKIWTKTKQFKSDIKHPLQMYVCMTILSDCDSSSSHIILTDYTHWFLIIVLLTTWILRAMHVWAGLNTFRPTSEKVTFCSKRDRWVPSIALIASFALHPLDWLSSK